ncbi:MAG: DMT family transporter [Candidatus Limivicinus sp.]|nr:DMT family transporter [Clostridiales bacterium]MDY3860020.1 DMT family transporter [Candidatus Limivicinus sp.]
MKKNYALLGRLALFCTAIIWGTSFVVLKSALSSIGALWVLAIRFSVSAVLLFAMAGKRIKTVSRRCIKGSVLMGLCIAVAYIVQTYGLVYTTPGKNAFLTATYCVLTPFLAWAVYKRRPGLSNVIAAVLCISGIGFVSLNEGFGTVNVGDVLTLACGVFYAFQIILMENYSDSGEATVISAVQFAVAALICWAGALIFEKPPVNVPAEAWLNIAYLSVMCTAVCFFLQAWGMKYTPSSTAAMIMTLEAVFGVIASILFYNEVITGRLALGFVLIFFAVVISEVRPFKGRKLA